MLNFLEKIKKTHCGICSVSFLQRLYTMKIFFLASISASDPFFVVTQILSEYREQRFGNLIFLETLLQA